MELILPRTDRQGLGITCTSANINAWPIWEFREHSISCYNCSVQKKRHLPFTRALEEVKDAKSIETIKRQFVLELYSELIQKILVSKCTSFEMSVYC